MYQTVVGVASATIHESVSLILELVDDGAK